MYSTDFIKILFVIVFSINLFRIIYFLQLKEYRLDRLWDFYKYDSGALKITSIFGYMALVTAIIFPNHLLVLLVLLLFNVSYNNLFRARLRFKPTAKAVLLFTGNIAAFIALSFILPLNYAYASSVLVLILLLAVLNMVSSIGKEIIILRAVHQMVKLPNIKIIAITGSYGKSSTKEFLHQVLSSQFSVVSTPKNINTDIGIAKFILTKPFTDKTDYFIVEAGAYKIGEIVSIVRMFPIDTAIITALGSQHLSLFGSLDNIQKAKLEIADTLYDDGTLYLNGDSPNQENLESKLSKIPHIKTYGTQKDFNLHLQDINLDNNLSFKLNDTVYKTNLNTPHHAHNLAPVIDIALQAGITTTNLTKILQSLSTLPTTLTTKTGRNKSTVLDDSYNSNLDGFLSAITNMKSISATNKIIITMGFLELGSFAPSAYKQIKQAIDGHISYLILTKPNLEKYFKDLKETKVFVSTNPTDTIEYLEKKINSDTLVLIENRIDPKVYQYLLEQN